jgi:hypothetical protein
MHVAVSDDLFRLLRARVENGQFPSEEAVVQEAIRFFLIGSSPQDSAPQYAVRVDQVERVPGPFLVCESDGEEP